MTGETDLATILASLTIARREELVTMVSIDTATARETVVLGDGIEAIIAETEGTTVVATVREAERRGWPVEFRAVWLTVNVHSSLEAVGLTAAMARVLTEKEIPCNVLAGFYHDHLLVPAERADEAIVTLEGLAK